MKVQNLQEESIIRLLYYHLFVFSSQHPFQIYRNVFIVRNPVMEEKVLCFEVGENGRINYKRLDFKWKSPQKEALSLVAGGRFELPTFGL